MYTFETLHFAEHPRYPFIRLAQMTMNSRYGISVVQGEQTYGSEEKDTYELAIFDGDFINILYDVPLLNLNNEPYDTRDVLKNLSREDVSVIMAQLQAAPDA